MQFKSVFIAVFLGTALLVSALLVNSQRPSADTDRATVAHVRATGKCVECHRAITPAVVHEFETSAHVAKGVTCLDCHQANPGQAAYVHNGFSISKDVTAGSCATCHKSEYDQFLRSRHALPAYSAVRGIQGLTKEQIAQGEAHHLGAVDRKPNQLVLLEGPGAMEKGCMGCHNIGAPNADGSIGSCTECHGRHMASISLAREPNTCGQCHMGPDHSQMEIYTESKHGALYHSRRHEMNLNADPKTLTTKDMSVPTCATCHMSGLEGQKVTHDTTERLSYWLFAPISKKRPGAKQGEIEMKETCTKCHATSTVDRFYTEAEVVVKATNEKVKKAAALMKSLRDEGLLTKKPFDEEIEFVYFDFWHYYGRTAKHGAYMGGADFVQWHGNYELLKLSVELQKMAAELRKSHGK